MDRNESSLCIVHNGKSYSYRELPITEFEKFFQAVLESIHNGLRVSAFFGVPTKHAPQTELVIVLADDLNNKLLVGRTRVEGKSFRSLTPHCPQLHLFEREIFEQCGLVPEGHPWLKPVRFGESFLFYRDEKRIPIEHLDFYRVLGDTCHEVAVGPIHAGVIEPGHFRFQCHGEEVLHLEISLGYQHRGIEEALLQGPTKSSLRQIETISGDSTIAHSLAYHQNLESLMGIEVPPRALGIRAVALELERLANHTGTLGALSGDVGYLPTMSFCGRLRGDFLNMTANLCGNRFGRSLLTSGGVQYNLSKTDCDLLLQRLQKAKIDLTHSVNLLWNSASVMSRFERTGVITSLHCQELGLVGVTARASGVERDVRLTHPLGAYQFHAIPVSVVTTGDVNSRAFVRFLELRRSIRFIRELLEKLPEGEIAVNKNAPIPNQFVVSLVEGHRGEVCHVAITNEKGSFLRYKIVDPSFHNWPALALSMRNQQISDFPLCNKSFDLSYCGHDL